MAQFSNYGTVSHDRSLVCQKNAYFTIGPIVRVTKENGPSNDSERPRDPCLWSSSCYILVVLWIMTRFFSHYLSKYATRELRSNVCTYPVESALSHFLEIGAIVITPFVVRGVHQARKHAHSPIISSISSYDPSCGVVHSRWNWK